MELVWACSYCILRSTDAENDHFSHTSKPRVPRLAVLRLHSRLIEILSGAPAASRLGRAHRRGAPYSSHRARQRVRLRFRLSLGRWITVLSILAYSIDRFPIQFFGTLQISPSCRFESLSVHRHGDARRSLGRPA